MTRYAPASDFVDDRGCAACARKAWTSPCVACVAVVSASGWTTGPQIEGAALEDKGIDVRIALDIVRTGLEGSCDVILLFSQDQDFVEVAAEVRVFLADIPIAAAVQKSISPHIAPEWRGTHPDAVTEDLPARPKCSRYTTHVR